MKKKLKIAILWADPYNKNLGVGALAYSSLALLFDVLKEKGIEGNLSFVSFSKNSSGTFDHNGQVVSFDNFPILDYLKLKSVTQLLLLPGRFKTRRLLGFDYIFDISGGDSFSDIYGKKRFYRMLNTKRFFAFLGKKIVLLPQTIGPFKDPVYEKEAFAIMNKMEMVISRDKQSFDYSKMYLPAGKIMESIDVAFYLPFKKMNFDQKFIHVGINVSGLLWNGGYTKDNQFDMKTNYKELIIGLIKYFLLMPDVQIHLVPHVIPENNPVEDDYAACEEIKKTYLPDAIIAPRFESPMQAKGYISGMNFFTGARMHACIGAFSSGVPVFLMAYSRKFNGLFIDTLQYKWMGDCVQESTESVFEHLKKAFEDRDVLKKQIQFSLDTIVKPRLETLKATLSKIIK